MEQKEEKEAQISSVSGVSLALAHSWLELKCYVCVCVGGGGGGHKEAIKAFIQVRVGLDKRPHSNAHQMITQLSGDHSVRILLAISWRKSPTGNTYIRCDL